MKIRLEKGLPHVSISLSHRGQQLELENVLLDTGSAGTIFSADKALALGLRYEVDDSVHRIKGVGGAEPRRHGRVRKPKPFPASAGVPGSVILPIDMGKPGSARPWLLLSTTSFF